MAATASYSGRIASARAITYAPWSPQKNWSSQKVASVPGEGQPQKAFLMGMPALLSPSRNGLRFA